MRDTAPQPESTTTLAQRAYNALAFLLAGGGLFLVIYIYLALQIKTWPMVTLTTAIGAFCGLTVVSMILVHQKRLATAVRLVIGGMFALFLVSALLVQGLGVILSLNMILLVLLLLWAVPVLPAYQTYIALLGTIIVGVIILSIDLIISTLTEVDFRLSLPQASILIPLVSAIIALIYAVIIYRQFRSYSLPTKLIISFIGVSLFSVLAVGLIINLVMTRLLTQSATQRLASAAKQTATTFDVFISNNFSILENEAQLSNFIDLRGDADFQPNGNAQWLALRTFRQRDPRNIISYGVLDKEGINLADTVSVNPNLSEADQEYFTAPMASDKPYISPVIFSKRYGAPILVLSVPIRNLLGNPVGVLRVIYRASVLQDLILQANNLSGEQSFAILVDENFLRLADGEAPDLVYTLLSPLTASQVEKMQAAELLPVGSPNETALELNDFRRGLFNLKAWPSFVAGVHRNDGDGSHNDQVYALPLSTKPEWKVAFVQAPEAFLAPVESQAQVLVLAALIIMAIVAGVAIWLGQYLAGPIVRLTAVTERVAAGDFEVQAKVESKDEIGQLATSLNLMTSQLGSLVGSLESQVAERTVDLALSMEVGQRASAIRTVEELIPTITNFIQDQFDLYYVQVLWVDDTGETLVQKAEASKSGAQAATYASIPINPLSVIGQAAASGTPVVIPDTHHHDLFVHDPMLTSTRSELVIPLLVENKVIAVLDMQSADRYHFTSDNLTVFQAMATQLAISIDSAEQWYSAQKSQRRAEEAVQQLTRQVWDEKLGAHKGRSIGYAYNLSEVSPLTTPVEAGLSAAIVVQNQSIGNLAVKPAENRPLSADEQLLVEAVAQQLAQKAENLRLFEATQEQANREQLARQITDKIRASRNIESALQTAASELSRALRVPSTVIDLYTPDNGDADPVLPK